MTKKKAIALAVFLVLAGAGYIYLYGGMFAKQTISIYHTRTRAAVMRRPNPNAPNAPPPPVNVTFAMETDTGFRLTSVKVVNLEEYKTNKFHFLWEMVSDSNSPPVKTFSYGENIKGMHPAIKGARPEPLSNDVAYRLFVVAGKIKGEHDFTLPSNPLGVPTNAAVR